MSESVAANSVNPDVKPPLDYAPPRGESLGKSTVRNSLWTVGSYGLINVIRLANNLILTALLVPELLGVMLVVTTVMIGIRLFSDVGIGPAVISNPRGEEEPFLRTAFATQIIRGFFIWLVACALAYPVTQSYITKDPLYASLIYLIPVAGFVAVIEGFRSTAVFRLQRKLDLKRIAILDIVEILATTIPMIIWAWISPTIWALLLPSLIGSVITTAVSHLLMRDRFDWPGWNADCAAELMKIGRWIFLSTALTFLAGQFDKLIFAKLVDPHTLGVFGVAVGLALMPITAIFKIGGSVLFPAFSRVADDLQRFATIYVRARTVLLGIGGAVVCGMIACSPFAVKMLYKVDYEAAGWMLQLLAIGMWFQIVDATNTAGLLAQRQPRWMAAGNLTKVVFMFSLVPLAYYMGYGFAGALIALGIADGLRMLTSTIGVLRLGIPRKALVADVMIPILATAVGLTIYYVVSHWAPFFEAQFAPTKTGRRLSNLILFALAGMQVFIVFAPFVAIAWKRSRRAQIIAT